MGLFWTIVIAQSIICGGFCAYIAGQKDRSVSAWFWLGILFGIFALIAIAAVPKQEDTTERQCPNCLVFNKRDADVCHSCNRYLR